MAVLSNYILKKTVVTVDYSYLSVLTAVTQVNFTSDCATGIRHNLCTITGKRV